ncbi:hypothetical protein Pmani_025718 [Petrolisthes manimaculis]|uniref:Uncharacterized protein n=1 Tax=Petrolisthes manimaculis TaxID=1843537 RepID=A0AAE1P507_9EUCA|nr:hypothetical protein Pmani_025718 [Petrolisthes manimaculis]
MVVECDRGGGVGGGGGGVGGGGGGGDMGWGRVVVGCVLSVISLTVLSLHVALCVHYPSPLFAVTLLLNPSLWMVVGGAGVGVAMAVTYRERQRKVRAAVCTCCHTRYGATTDPAKCTTVTTNGAAPHRPRGPSRAVYAYNGTSHKMFSSYGTISHDHHRRHSHHAPYSTQQPHTSSSSSHGTHTYTPSIHLYTHTYIHSISNFQSNATHLLHHHPAKEKEGGVEGGVDMVTADGKQEVEGNDREQQQQQQQTSADNNTTTSSSSSSSSSVSTTTNSLSTATNSLSSATNSLTSSSQSCSCGAGLRTRQLGWRPRSESGAGMGGRRPTQAATVRSFGGHKRLVMPCRTRPPGHVPVHLFAATASSTTRPTTRDTPHDSDGGNDSGTAASNSPPPPRPVSPLLDPDVASLSSECGLLAGEEGDESQMGRDLAMSPLLGAQKAGKKEHQQDQDSPPLDTHQGESVKSRPLSSLLAGTRRVLGRPRWPRTPQTRQDHQRTSTHHHNSRSPSRELLASPRKRRAPGSVWGMGVWRQQQQQQTPAKHNDKDNEAPIPCQATTPPGGVLESVRPRDTWQRRQRHGKVRQRPASDSVLLLSDDAAEE